MSYCVNCGVELDASATKCPLCDTPVYNPKAPEPEKQPSPFPKEKGQVEVVKRKDLGVLLTVIVLATAVTCGLLNAFVFRSSLWSLAVIGVVLVLWVIMIPVVIYTRQPIYLSILLDGVAVIVYLYLLTYLTGHNSWFYGLYPQAPHVLPDRSPVPDLGNRCFVRGTGTSDRPVPETGDRTGMVGYRADDLRDRRYHHRHPFIPEETAQCSAQKIALLITIQSKQPVNLLFGKASEMRFWE